jgi:hypothetical protein
MTDVLGWRRKEKLYGTMKDFDAGRTKQTVELIIDRDTTAASQQEGLRSCRTLLVAVLHST